MSTGADEKDASTPLMKQFWELKSQAGDALLLFRMGDFYELFGPDAIEAARILEITLTSRDKNKPHPVPMCGVPHHSVQSYIQKLLRSGKKVAIGEQMEDPAALKAGSKLVRRAVVRTFTPGIHFDSEGAEANYLGVIVPGRPGVWALACLDAATGEALISEEISGEALEAEAGGLPIRHVLVLGEKQHWEGKVGAAAGVLFESLPTNYLSIEQASDALKKHYDLEQLSGLASSETALRALGIAVVYTLRSQQQAQLSHLRLPVPLRKPSTLVLGPRTAQHLDLISLGGQDTTPTLYQLINRTSSALGARTLRQWLLAPLRDVGEISARQAGVREFANGSEAGIRVFSKLLSEVYDLERIMGRVNANLANPRDTLALGRTLSVLPGLVHLLSNFQAPGLLELKKRTARLAAELQELALRITTQQEDEAPFVTRDGGIFKSGVDPELDRLLSLSKNGQLWLVELEARERAATGISTLKVRYNRVFGYYIEVTQTHLKNVPAHYQRKQTTVGSERFFTEELKKFEDDFVNASTRQKALEQELFQALLTTIQSKTAPVMEAAAVLGEVDSNIALAKLALEPGWNFPEINDSLELVIEAGRHPLVDVAMRGGFVPNDLNLGTEPAGVRTLIITGPNMGGKSTIMRQTALIVVLGQMGAPVPALQARWGAVSSLYTRIGAHDAIARGQSTFMVEMSELAHILNYADQHSLIILDEIGRGTSTYDGMSVAWAALEWLCTRIRARTLFATHYHELTRLSATLPATGNAHLAVEGTRALRGGSLRFLYKLKDGPTNESFGIHVAQIAGLPKAVVQRAWGVLEELESHAPQGGTGSHIPGQLSLFGSLSKSEDDASVPAAPEEIVPHPVLLELENADVNGMTPIQALNLIAKLREMSLEASSGSGAEPSRKPGRE
ncbi:MAG: DNA mismatch repair protein MutS [Bdellovibrionales bacterium GWA1_52_35]|nr:MAG: DNA mismatch repair protein MutS [Bdellovibrionales bacterium GWA1_52_35]